MIKDKAEVPTKRLEAYGDQLKTVLQVIRTDQSTRKFLDEPVASFEATSGAVYLREHGRMQLVQSSGDWNGDSVLSVPMPTRTEQTGALALVRGGTD
jgi:hypothetical protein